MKKILLLSMAMLAINAQAADKPTKATESSVAQVVAEVDKLDRTIEVAYNCKKGNETQPVTVMYGVHQGALVIAQLKLGDELTPNMKRVLFDPKGKSRNSYLGMGAGGEDIAWFTEKATPANVTSKNGLSLEQKISTVKNGKTTTRSSTLLSACKVDKETTKSLNKK